MKAKRIYREEQMKLIMECRTSGLYDYQWCQSKGIHPGTFYNWISKLRKKGVTIPDSESKTIGTALKQEVVKVDLIPEHHSIANTVGQNTNIPATTSTESQPAVEISIEHATIRFFDGIDPELLKTTLHWLGGVPHAW